MKSIPIIMAIVVLLSVFVVLSPVRNITAQTHKPIPTSAPTEPPMPTSAPEEEYELYMPLIMGGEFVPDYAEEQ